MNSITYRSKGFTIVEMLVVIMILGLLTGLSTFGFRNWQQGLAKTQVQSDLRQVTAVMDAQKNFGNGYPTSIPSSFKVGDDVTVSFVWGDATRYCIQGTSSKYSSVAYYVDTTQGKDPKTGNCPASPIQNTNPVTAPTLTLASVTNNTATVSWTNVTDATAYTVRYGTSSPTTVFACSNSPCTITGLASNTTYKVNVTASNSGSSATSSTIDALTAPSAPTGSPTLSVTIVANGIPKNNVQNFTITASGGTYAQGTKEWKLAGSEWGEPNWDSRSWQTSNIGSYSRITNGVQGPQPLTAYALVRCSNSSGGTEYPSTISSDQV